jgi:hypothetical protein
MIPNSLLHELTLTQHSIRVGIHTLAPELHHMICSYLPSADTKSLRLVNKYFADVGLDHLFSELSVFFNKHSFEELIAASQHPIISKKARAIFYEPLLLDEDIKELEDYKTAIMARQAPGSRYSPSWQNHVELDESFNKYKSLVRDQIAIRSSRLDLEHLTTAFSNLPNLREVTVSCADRIAKSKQMYKQYEDGMLQPRAEDESDDNISCSKESLEAFLKAGIKAGITLDSFAGLQLSWRIFELDNQILTMNGALCTSLTQLELKLLEGDGGPDHMAGMATECMEFFSEGVVCNFLKQLPNLRSLSFGFDGNIRTEDYQDNFRPGYFQDILPADYTWPHLEEFHLCQLEGSEEFLFDFLTRHKGTIKALGLEDIRFDVGSWMEFLPRLRELLGKQLTDVVVCGDLEAGDTEGWSVPPPGFAFEFEDEWVMRGWITMYIKGEMEHCPLNRDTMMV